MVQKHEHLEAQFLPEGIEQVTDNLPEPVKVLVECLNLQASKGADYQSTKSSVRQADYYPSGCLTILEIMHAKMLRMRSLIEASMNDTSHEVKHESIEDSAKDLINYSSFLVSYLRGKIDGQDPNKDFLNRRIK